MIISFIANLTKAAVSIYLMVVAVKAVLVALK